MKIKCMGCGATIQTISPKQKGYIDIDVLEKKKDNFYCKRCFELRNYHKNQKIEISDKDYNQWINKINKDNGLIVFIVDLLDLDGTLPTNLNKIFPGKQILLVANKIDLFPKSFFSIRSEKEKDIYFQQRLSAQKKVANLYLYLKELDIHVVDIVFMSGKSRENIDYLISRINPYLTNTHSVRNVYFVGMTNVGKSTILNQIIKHYTDEDNVITVSNSTNTTLDFIYVPFNENNYFIDTPGLNNMESYISYLDKKTLDTIAPKNVLKPKVFQLNPKQTLFIQGFLQINFISGKKSSFVTYVANQILVHRTKLENSQSFYDEHLDDILLFPTKQERNNLGNRKKLVIEFNNLDKGIDISIPGIGFIHIFGEGIMELYYFEKIKINKRKAIF